MTLYKNNMLSSLYCTGMWFIRERKTSATDLRRLSSSSWAMEEIESIDRKETDANWRRRWPSSEQHSDTSTYIIIYIYIYLYSRCMNNDVTVFSCNHRN